MAVSVQFVDSISSSATVLLDLSVDPYLVAADVDLSPPPVRRSSSSSFLRDGDRTNATAYANRVVGVTVEITASTSATVRAASRALYQQLAAERNILRVTIDGTSFYFRTFRAPDSTLALVGGSVTYTTHKLDIPAEPFAYGEEVSLGTLSSTVAGDLVVNVPAVQGDVPTPMLLRYDGSPSSDVRLFAGQRTGTFPTRVIVPVDSWTSSATLTTVSPTGGNNFGDSYKTWTATAAGQSVRLTGTGVTLRSGQTDRTKLAGTYRVLMSTNFSATPYGTSWQIDFGLDDQTNPTWYPVLASTTVSPELTMETVDLGLVQFPVVNSQTALGLGGGQELADVTMSIQVTRVDTLGGSQTFGFDTLLLIPADESLLILDYHGRLDVGMRVYVDPFTGQLVCADTSTGQIRSDVIKTSYVGSPPMLSPTQATNLVLVRDVGNLRAPTVPGSIIGSYWPRYLTVA